MTTHPDEPDNQRSGSPLSFAREYQAYRQIASEQLLDDSRLLLAARFWCDHSDALIKSAYHTFRDEDLPPLLDRTAVIDLNDLHPDELHEITEFFELCRSVSELPAVSLEPFWDLTTRKWFYLGQAGRAMTCLRKMGYQHDDASESEWSDGTAHYGPEFIESLAESVGSTDSECRNWLLRFASEWHDTLDMGYPNRAQGLLVEYDRDRRPVRGRLAEIEARVEPISDGERNEIVIDHQVRQPDDPHCEAFKTALVLVRNRSTSRSKTGGGQYLSGRYVLGKQHGTILSGGSMGLAAFLVSHGTWRNRDIHRERHIIGRSVTLTGAVKSDGSVAGVEPETLTQKIERAFHSPIHHLVIAKDNLSDAESAIATLHKSYPSRKLHLISAEHISDVLLDHNVIRPERLCLGEFAAKKVGRLGKSAAVQIPALLLALYLLLCLVYPKAWVGFDWNPADVKLTESTLIAYNADGSQIWMKEFDCIQDTAQSQWKLGQLDVDDASELIFLIMAKPELLSELTGTLFAFDDDGEELFRRNAIVEGEYPGDEGELQTYYSSVAAIHGVGDSATIMTVLLAHNPARSHLKFFTNRGKPIGWFVNAGFVANYKQTIFDPSSATILATGVNNRMKAACFLALKIDSCTGVSPPYSDASYSLEGVRRGTQLHYLLFPPTDFCRQRKAQYNGTNYASLDSPGIIKVRTDEYGAPRNSNDSTAMVDYYLDFDCNILGVSCSDDFKTARDIAVAEGKLTPVDWPSYEAALRDSVLIWLGESWASQAQLKRRHE